MPKQQIFGAELSYPWAELSHVWGRVVSNSGPSCPIYGPSGPGPTCPRADLSVIHRHDHMKHLYSLTLDVLVINIVVIIM